MVNKEDLDDLLKDLKKYVVEDDYPISTISNVYFDTEDFDVIQDALAKQNRREKIRMRTYVEHPTVEESGFSRSKSQRMQKELVISSAWSRTLPPLPASWQMD